MVNGVGRGGRDRPRTRPTFSQPSYRRRFDLVRLECLAQHDAVRLRLHGEAAEPPAAPPGCQCSARPTTRSISERTRRSTMRREVGVQPVLEQRTELVPHHVLERRTAAVHLGLRDDSVRTRLPTEDAAAAAAAGATSEDAGGPRGSAGTCGGGDRDSSCGACVRRRSASARGPSWRDRARTRRRRLSPCIGGLGPAEPVSSSLRMRRMEARMSSIEGSPPAGAGSAGSSRGRRAAHRITSSALPARLVGRIVARAGPPIAHVVVIGGLVIERHRQIQVAGRQPADRGRNGVGCGDEI